MRVERNHGINSLLWQLWKLVCYNRDQVLCGQRGHLHLCEAVQKALWQALAPATLVNRILARKQAEPCTCTAERAVELWDKHLATMIQARVEALEHRL